MNVFPAQRGQKGFLNPFHGTQGKTAYVLDTYISKCDCCHILALHINGSRPGLTDVRSFGKIFNKGNFITVTLISLILLPVSLHLFH